ncbi:hypothetical protein [Micromonospora sp. LOL_023]|uniref:hypothetical protein n=1 Tax=Micromonospora sp. LOL_023 TaxID=3345418 RepID=UPI003A839F6F
MLPVTVDRFMARPAPRWPPRWCPDRVARCRRPAILGAARQRIRPVVRGPVRPVRRRLAWPVHPGPASRRRGQAGPRCRPAQGRPLPSRQYGLGRARQSAPLSVPVESLHRASHPRGASRAPTRPGRCRRGGPPPVWHPAVRL